MCFLALYQIYQNNRNFFMVFLSHYVMQEVLYKCMHQPITDLENLVKAIRL